MSIAGAQITAEVAREDATAAIYDFSLRPGQHRLIPREGPTANSAAAPGAALPAATWQPQPRRALARIWFLCPILPASAATGRLPG
jgi:hypothetical protein